MKKIITALFASIFATSVQAQPTFTYYMMTTSNSPSIKVTETLVDKLKQSYNIDWKPNAGCAIKNQVEKDTNPMFVEFVPGQYWMSLYEGNKNCVFDIEKIRYLMIVENSYAFCVRKDSDLNSVQDLLSKENNVAYPTGVPVKPLIEQMNKQYDAKLKPVMVTNSNSAVTALLAKDVNVAFIVNTAAAAQLSQGTVKCIGTTESNQDHSLDKTLTKISPAITQYHVQYVIGLKNVDDAKFKEISAELTKILSTTQLPNTVRVTSLNNSSEADLTRKVHKITKDLYEATK